MVLGQVAGMAAAYCSRHGLPVQDADAGYLRKTMEEDPCLDGSAPDVIIDDDSPLVEVPSDWIREKGSSGYGPTFLRSVPGDNSGKVIYHIPDNLKGEYAVYAYQQKVWSNPLVTWTFSGHECSGTTSISVNLESLAIAGQTSGEWIPLGTFRPGRGATIEVSFGPSADLPCKSDALLLLPKHTETE